MKAEPGTEIHKPRFPRWPWYLLLLLGVVAGVAAWWWKGSIPAPPGVPAGESDPAFVQAIEVLRTKVRQEPRSGRPWGLLGQVFLANGYPESAQTCFVQAQRFDPRNPRWPYYHGLMLLPTDPEADLALLRQAADLSDTEDSGNTAPRLSLAERLLQCQRPVLAETEFRRVLQQDPTNLHANYGLGLVAVVQGDLSGARACFERCARSPLARQRAAVQLARILRQQGDAAGAAAALQQARQLPRDVDWPDPYMRELLPLVISETGLRRRAQVLKVQGRFLEAAALLQQRLPQGGDYATYLALGDTLAKAQDYARAVPALREAFRLDANQFAAPHLLSMILVDQAIAAQDKPEQRQEARELFEEAARFARRAVAVQPENPTAQMFLGVALKSLGRRPEALAAFGASVRASPKLAEPYLYLAEMLADDGKAAEARPLVEQASRLAPKDDPRLARLQERLQKAAVKGNTAAESSATKR
jgi:tetratricopeptide (TPR) repeat protein